MIVMFIIIITVIVVMNYAVTLTPSLVTDAVPAEGLPKSCSYSSLVTM